MDDVIQIILAFLVSIIIFFIFPIYIAYEKKDDLSYALATKYVSDFVEEVKVKGYVSSDMYEKLNERLLSTGNTFDIYMEHRAKKVYPGTAAGTSVQVEELYTEKQILPVIGHVEDGLYTPKYKADKNGNLIGINDIKNSTLRNQLKNKNKFNIYRTSVADGLKASYSSTVQTNININTNLQNIPLKADMFYAKDDEGNIMHVYAMNIGDEFTVRVKNNNVTVAASLFDSFTTNSLSPDTTRIYVNYGAVITSEKYW